MIEPTQSDTPFALLEQNLADLEAAPGVLGSEAQTAELMALLAQCTDVSEHSDRPILRSLHHFACTGGTLISKCIAAMPCIRLLSEVDPLSEIAHTHPFVPTDMVGLAKFSSAPPSDADLLRVFLAGLSVLEVQSRHEGRDLVLRDHSHSHFCCAGFRPERPSLREMLRPEYMVLSLVTVRHPLDTYLSVARNGWVHWEPGTLEEYANRYHLFLDHYADVDVLRYEDFLANPVEEMRKICGFLKLPFNPHFQDVFSALHLSGDSGRSSAVIGTRPRRAVPEEIFAQALASQSYQRLCARLGYSSADPTGGGAAENC